MLWILVVSHAHVAVGIEHAFVRENMIRGHQIGDLRGIEGFAVLSSQGDGGQQQSTSNKSDKCFHSLSKRKRHSASSGLAASNGNVVILNSVLSQFPTQ